MKRVLVLLLALGGVAVADAPVVQAPAGWHADVEQATSLAAKANEVSHFGVARSLATAEVYVAGAPGVALFVTAVAAKVPAADRAAAARVAMDELHDATSRAALAGTGIVVDSSDSSVDAKTKEVRGALHWRDTNAGTTTHARIVIAADEENLISVTGECVVGSDAPAKEVTACTGALATLNPGIAADKRVELALAPPGTRPPEPARIPNARPPATMDDGSRTPMPPIKVPQQTATADRRPVYVGLGIVVLAAVFWWNQRRRARFEKEEDQ